MKDKIYRYEQENYNLEEIKSVINKIFEEEKLLDDFKKGKTVFLKVNLLRGANPNRAVTTHPIFVRAVGEVLLENGMKVIVGDSPAGPFTKTSLKGIYRACGLLKELENTEIELNYNVETVNIRKDSNLKLKEFTVFKALLDADYIINLPKLKTHTMMRYTGAVKNMFGAIVGLIKANYHFKLKEAENFAHHLIDVVETIKPDFNIIDGIVGMEGDGPSSGESINSNIILAGKNPYALDKVAIDFIGFTEEEVYTVKLSRNRGLFDKVEIFGDEIETMTFKRPEGTQITFLPKGLPKGLEKFLLNQLKAKLIFKHKKCVSCGDCVRICPAKIIYMNDENYPYYEREKCISCFCCHEVCPVDAIEIKNPILTNLFRR